MSYQKSFVFSVPVLSFQIFAAKLILWPKICLTYAISEVNWIFILFVKKWFFAFLQ